MGEMKCSTAFVWWLLLLAGLAAPVLAEDPPATPVSPPIPQTQLTLRLDPLQGRATVVAIAGQTLTIVTAAHFLAPEDAGRAIQIQGDAPLRGRLVAVTRNPGYRPVRSRQSDTPPPGTLGIDTAVALIKVDLRRESERRTFARIRSAEWTRDPVLSSSGHQILSVHIVDQHGREHIVRAGNHLNPRCLAWGRQHYDTQRGDSGSGVFLMRTTPEGQQVPVLIGNVAQTDDRGGLASLAYRNEDWIVRALAGQPAEPK
jgi:hypothetical protein